MPKASEPEGLAPSKSDAIEFLFVRSLDKLVGRAAQKCSTRSADHLEEVDQSLAFELSGSSIGQAAVSSFALSIPTVLAAHHGLPTQVPMAMSCMPMMIPFRVPQVSPQSWMANKRALAFHRCCVLIVYAQGAIALVRFAHGDLIGGIYDAVQALMGGYATQPDGISFFPSYIMICGFNGILNFLQVMQSFHGVPIHFLPWLAIIPPAVSLLGAYCGWQFSKEVRAIYSGLNTEGAQDSGIVRMFAADWWPRNFLSPTMPGSDEGVEGISFDRSRFTAFAGNGQRLGSS